MGRNRSRLQSADYCVSCPADEFALLANLWFWHSPSDGFVEHWG